MRKGKIYIGTSGWHYKHWKGTFYPADVRAPEQFTEYKKYFRTVELNNSFYKLPEAATFAGWKNASPRGFLFSVKASRFFTHMKKLIIDKQGFRRFFSRAGKLEEKLGPILFQLPPRWKVNAERLKSFVSALPAGHRYTFEFREHSWYNEEVYAILRDHHCAFCIYELAGHTSPLEVTADFVYVRLHGPGNKYQGSYDASTLKKWARRCRSRQNKGLDVYIYFDNDEQGYAAFNAVTLRQLIK